MKPVILVLMSVLSSSVLHAREFHVCKSGSDSNPGTEAAPFLTISAAAVVAQPGDTITVHAGTYRERINPPRGGISDERRITYRAAEGEIVVIKGSEVIKGWKHWRDDVWTKELPIEYFGEFNPFEDVLHGDWFKPKGRRHHTGAVYLNGQWLVEAPSMESLFDPMENAKRILVSETKSIETGPMWFAKRDGDSMDIIAQFPGVDPNEELVEINKRQTVFYPDRPGVDFSTLRGFTMQHAATPWAPPTAEQIGLIGTHWSKGWIIENNTISHSVCAGVTLGKYGDAWDNSSEELADGYNQTIERALENGWNRETVGSHIVRNNTISHCEQAGIVGSLGAIFSTITGNTIHDIHVRRLFTGHEMAGIKLHGAIDTEISHNHIHHSFRALWLDWMTQGTRVTGNLFHDNWGITVIGGRGEDFWLEVNHGPLIVDNNISLSDTAMRILSQGTAFVHNLFAGEIHLMHYDPRTTPFHEPHSTRIAGLHDNPSGDDRYMNNIFIGEKTSLAAYDEARMPVDMSGNVFLNGSIPSTHEPDPVLCANEDSKIQIVEEADGFYLEMEFGENFAERSNRQLITSALLGYAVIPNAGFESPDGSPILIDKDYFGHQRDTKNPFPGPIEMPNENKLRIKVWPKQ